jgi:hypothetical protein
MSIEDRIKNVELLVNTMGQFPTFHDSEVLQIVLDRGDRKTIPANLLAKIRVLKLVSKDDGNGNYLWNKHLVELRFFSIEKVALQGFNFQNVLFDLHIEEISEPLSNEMKYQVVFESSHGVEMEFQCSEVAVESVGSAERIKDEPVDEKTKQERKELFQKLVEEHLRGKRDNES